ncbi:MAG: flagellar motor switch protein FliN [Desulfobacteraceae bacterium]|nr:flagellar motor switch protein FliN [Desulfobacteraceae bacterium]
MKKIRITAVEKTIANSITETFDTMIGLELARVGKIADQRLNENRFVGSVSYGGEVVGTMSIHISEQFARFITAEMLGIKEKEIEGLDEVKDVLGEITNIVSGNLKSDFLDNDLKCVISTPSITRGSDFKIESSQAGELHSWIFRHKKNDILIEISLKEDIGATKDLFGSGDLTPEEVLAKINSVDLSTNLINAVIDVFYTMLSMEIENIGQVPDDFKEEKRTVGVVSFAGDVHGVFIIQVNDSFARTMTAAMLSMQEDEIESEEDVFDVIREISNIIGGNLKSGFVDAGLSCVLSTPSITNGLDFRVESLNIIKTQRFLFKSQAATIIVDAGIKRDEVQSDVDETDTEKDTFAASDEAKSKKKDEVDDELKNLDLILGIPMELTIELGRARRSIREVLNFGAGSVVELAQLDGEPVDVLVNDTLIAKGEVLVEREKYGIRIVEVVSRKQRVLSMK